MISKCDFIVRIIYDDGSRNVLRFPRYAEARDEFDRIVKYAKAGGRPQRIELVRRIVARGLARPLEVETLDGVFIHEPLSLPEQVAVKFPYKIHGLKTANGQARSANTQQFYGSYDEALAAASDCATRPNGGDAIVIYKAVKVVRAKPQPVEVEEVEVAS